MNKRLIVAILSVISLSSCASSVGQEINKAQAKEIIKTIIDPRDDDSVAGWTIECTSKSTQTSGKDKASFENTYRFDVSKTGNRHGKYVTKTKYPEGNYREGYIEIYEAYDIKGYEKVTYFDADYTNDGHVTVSFIGDVDELSDSSLISHLVSTCFVEYPYYENLFQPYVYEGPTNIGSYPCDYSYRFFSKKSGNLTIELTEVIDDPSYTYKRITNSYFNDYRFLKRTVSLERHEDLYDENANSLLTSKFYKDMTVNLPSDWRNYLINK